jgi:hypothetical protein
LVIVELKKISSNYKFGIEYFSSSPVSFSTRDPHSAASQIKKLRKHLRFSQHKCVLKKEKIILNDKNQC